MSSVPAREARRHSRVQLPLAAEVSCLPLACYFQAAYLRDISASGAFFYVQMSPPVGTRIKIEFFVQILGGKVQISCEGEVVRVEPRALGEQNGIAIQFYQLNVGSW